MSEVTTTIIHSLSASLFVLLWYFVGLGNRSRAALCGFILCSTLVVSNRLLYQQVSALQATVQELQEQACECSDE